MPGTPSSPSSLSTDQPESGLPYSRSQLAALAHAALDHARKLGATDAGAEAS